MSSYLDRKFAGRSDPRILLIVQAIVAASFVSFRQTKSPLKACNFSQISGHLVSKSRVAVFQELVDATEVFK